jgi:hypothetical protein
MQVGFGSTHAGNVKYGTLDRLGVTFVRNFAVKHFDVILDYDVHSWDIEPLLERSQMRTDSVGKYVVSNVGIRRTAGQPVADSIEPPAGIAKPSSKDVGSAPRHTRSAGALDEGGGGKPTGESTDSE